MQMQWVRGAILGAIAVVALSGCQNAALTSARIYIQQEDWESAVEQLEATVIETPGDAEAWELLGLARANLGDYADAGVAFDRAVAADPARAQQTEARRGRFRAQSINRGVDALSSQDFVAAAAAFEAAAGVDPRSVDAQRSLGYIYYQQARVDEALAAYWRALELDPGHEDTAMRLGYVYYNEKRWEEAVDMLAPIAVGATDAELLTILANAYLELEREEDAFAALQAARDVDPGDVGVLLELGRILWHRGDFAAAAEAYAQASAADPADADAHHNLAMARLELARMAEEQGEADEAQAHADAAADLLERVVELNPAAGDAWYWLGVLYAKSSRVEDSERAFQKAADLGVE